MKSLVGGKKGVDSSLRACRLSTPLTLTMTTITLVTAASVNSALVFCCQLVGTADDYEDWVPHGKGNTNGCLLGQKATIKRPKKESL